MRGFVPKIVKSVLLRDIRSRVQPDPRCIPASKQPLKLFSYPELGQSGVENARLFAGRENLVKHFAPALKGGTVVEVGVMYGDFSEFLLRAIEPELFVAIDMFKMHDMPVIWDKPSSARFQGMTHREFYESAFY